MDILIVPGQFYISIFSDERKLKDLIKLGAIMDLGMSAEFITSVAEERLRRTQSISAILLNEKLPEMLTSDGSTRTVIDAYCREVRRFTTEDDFWKYCPILNVDYYLFKKGCWYTKYHVRTDDKIVIMPLVEAYARYKASEE